MVVLNCRTNERIQLNKENHSTKASKKKFLPDLYIQKQAVPFELHKCNLLLEVGTEYVLGAIEGRKDFAHTSV